MMLSEPKPTENVISFDRVSKRYLRSGSPLRAMRHALFRPKFLSGTSKGGAAGEESWALDDVSFKVGRGEVFGVVGPNGAGKSTVLKLLAGLSKPTNGQVRINGRVVPLLEVGAGFHPELTGRENIYLNGSIIGMSNQEIRRQFDSIAEFSGLRDVLDVPVKRYSSGMYMRLGFAVAAHANPDILLVDEVLAVGDASFQRKCLEKISEFRDEGKTIIFVSHALQTVQGLCDRALCLVDGRVNAQGTPDRVVNSYLRVVSEQQYKNMLQQTNEPLKRHGGSGEVQIHAIDLLGEDRASQQVFGSSDRMRVRMVYGTRTEIVKPVVLIGAMRIDGTTCFGTTSKLCQFDIELLHERGEIVAEIDPIQLLPGFYKLHVLIKDERQLLEYDHRSTNYFEVRCPDANLDYVKFGVFFPRMRFVDHRPLAAVPSA